MSRADCACRWTAQSPGLVEPSLVLVVCARHRLAALESHRWDTLAWRCVVISHPVTRNFTAVCSDKIEAQLVRTLQLDVFGGQDKVGNARRLASSDQSRFL